MFMIDYNTHMKLPAPFIPSRGFECGQTCAAMMIKYFRPNFEPDFDEFNKIIRHQDGKYTFPGQNAILLDHYGLRAAVYSSDDIPTLTKDPQIFHKWFGDEYDTQIKNINLAEYDYMARYLKNKKLFTKKVTTINDMVDLLNQGVLVSFVVDWNRLSGKTRGYAGHALLLTGVENNNLLVHDPDVGPYIPYPKDKLEYAYSHPIITHDCFAGFGTANL